MIHIDSLRMRLPTGFQHRAQNIAHLVAASVGNAALSGEYRLKHLSTPAIQVSANTTDQEIAHSIVTGIVTGLQEQK